MDFKQMIKYKIPCLFLFFLMACSQDENPIITTAELAGEWTVTEVFETYDVSADTLLYSATKSSKLTLNQDGETGEYIWANLNKNILYHYFSQEQKISIVEVFPGSENTFTNAYDILKLEADQMVWEKTRTYTNINNQIEEKYVDRWELTK